MLGVLLLCLLISAPAAAQEKDLFTLTYPKGPVSAPLGGSVVLGCVASYSFDPDELHWYQPQPGRVRDRKVLVYERKKLEEEQVDPRYKGRTSLTEGLPRGDGSLRLHNLTLADRGQYVCYMHNGMWYEEATISLIVTVTGSVPVVALSQTAGGQVNISCVSEGWTPQPTVYWTGRQGQHINQTSSPVCYDGSGGVTALFIITLLVLVALIIGMAVAYKKEKEPLSHPGLPPPTNEKIPPEMKDEETNTKDMIIVTPEWDSLKPYEVEKICLEVKGIPEFLKIKDGPGVKTEVWCPDPAGVQGHGDRAQHVLCEQRFNRGKHCWGVKIWITLLIKEMAANDKKIKQKQSWYVGVCRDSPEKYKKVPLTPENGFWILQYEKGTGLFVNTDPPTPVPVAELFKRLGVFLDCDKRTLSFYNVDTNSHLCTFESVGGMSGALTAAFVVTLLVLVAVLIGIFVAHKTGTAEKGINTESTAIIVTPELFTLTYPKGPVLAPLGGSVVLGCVASYSFDPDELHWYLPGRIRDRKVLVYERQKLKEEQVDPQYNGRTSLTEVK
ncbi:butyrophilin subfamily 3 member A1-like [Engraulis encrasicolus]|uniref:butyrophilin subfamily 3 member A1-like n=1 Tax=Engraulis encrasicolus TaxID=184585 RepID=UPI002FCF7DB1